MKGGDGIPIDSRIYNIIWFPFKGGSVRVEWKVRMHP